MAELYYLCPIGINRIEMSDTKIRVGITQGDINGIGYEVIIKSLLDPRICELCTPIIYGSAKAAGFYRRQIADAENFSYNIISKASDAHSRRVNLVDCTSGDLRIEPGKMTAEAGRASIAALQAAAADLKSGQIDVVVTAPICKENVHEAGFDFTGHTEFFAAEFGGEPLMMMCSELLKVGLVTIHVPLAEVAPAVTEAKIVAALHGLRNSLIQDFSICEPKIAVLALNPHAGDGGVIGREEQEIITPAIRTAFTEGILAFGPFPADGFFAAGTFAKYDAVLAMYHDQGLAPFKALSGEGVNFTAGLPIVRTSPAHGVGFDIAGQDKADAQAMRNAIYIAMDILRSRELYAEISADPLQKFKRENGVDVSAADLPETDEM